VNLETLLLTDDEVKALISMKEVIQNVELAFKEKGLKRVQMPAKIYLFYTQYNGDLRVMPSYLERLDISAVKVVNVHPDNKEKYGFPTVMAVVVLVDPRNGFPLAIMGGKTITDMRTGAAGGIAAKYLAKKNPKNVAFVGAGDQAKTQLMGIFEVFKGIEEVRVWSRSRETKEKFLREAEHAYEHLCKLVSVAEVREAVDGADIVVTTTPSRAQMHICLTLPNFQAENQKTKHLNQN
jgi:alanine dehydrogenase